jgi:hypothetical protein
MTGHVDPFATDTASPDDQLVSVQIDLGALRHALRTDPEFFINFFLGDEIRSGVPEFHKIVFGHMTSLDPQFKRFACAVPRDHAKTTLAKLSAVWYLLFSPYRFIVYLSNTAPIAIEACKDIIGFIESENFRAVFGDAEYVTKQEGTGLYKFRIGDKLCILRALGAGQQVRGINIDNQRPELAIVDDLEDSENIATPHLLKKLRRWFYGTFRKALDKFNHKIIQIGNLVQADCILNSNLESDYWASMRLGALLENSKPLWPEAWSIEKLREDFVEYLHAGQIHTWFAEMMNIPLPEGKGLITPEEIGYIPGVLTGQHRHAFITVDPAVTKETWGDKTAIVAHVFMEDAQAWTIGEYVHERGMDPLEIIRQAIQMAIRWGAPVIGVEGVAYQKALVFFFRYFLIEYNVLDLEVVELMPSNASKTTRLATWAGYLRNRTYYLPEGDIEITEQLLRYDPAKTNNADDLIDACAYGVQMLEGYLHIIQRTISLLSAPQPAIGTTVAAI